MRNEIFIISTNSHQVPDATATLLGLPKQNGHRYSFGDGPFPLLGIDHTGKYHILDHNTTPASYPKAGVWIIPDAYPLEEEFTFYLKDYLSQNTIKQVYLMLHNGESSYHHHHEKSICKAAGKQVDKIIAHKGHHTIGHPIGNGLEKVAQCLRSNDSLLPPEGLQVALECFRHAPGVYSPFQRAAMKVHKKLIIMQHTYDGSAKTQYDLQKDIRALNNDEDFKIAALKIDVLVQVNDSATFRQVLSPVLDELQNCFS